MRAPGILRQEVRLDKRGPVKKTEFFSQDLFVRRFISYRTCLPAGRSGFGYFFLEEYQHIFRSVKNDQWKFQKSFFPQHEQCKDAKRFREPEGCQIIQMKG